MDRVQYIQGLKNKLNKLPTDECMDAVRYYEEYFDEAGPENEQNVIKELGSPEKLASTIKVHYAVKDMEQSNGSTKKSLKVILIVMLGIFASPIAIPVAAAIFALIVGVVISLLAVLFAMFAIGIGVAGAGLFSAIAAIAIIAQSPATFIFFIGFGFSAIAAGIALFMLTFYLCKICFVGIAKAVSGLIVTNGRKYP